MIQYIFNEHILVKYLYKYICTYTYFLSVRMEKVKEILKNLLIIAGREEAGGRWGKKKKSSNNSSRMASFKAQVDMYMYTHTYIH